MNKFKVAIIDTEDEISKYEENLREKNNIELVGAFSGVNAEVTKVLELNPDVVVMEILLPGADGIDIAKKLKNSNKKLKVIVMSNVNSTSLIEKAIDGGVDYYMMKPVNYELLTNKIEEVASVGVEQNADKNKKLEEKITNIFLTVGIPAHIKGYQFLREAIKMAVGDPHIINSITKKLYPNIAEMYDTTASKVERAIRHAIEVAWNKGKIENINDVFGLRVYDTHEKPTNGEFIALVADKMLLEK